MVACTWYVYLLWVNDHITNVTDRREVTQVSPTREQSRYVPSVRSRFERDDVGGGVRKGYMCDEKFGHARDFCLFVCDDLSKIC